MNLTIKGMLVGACFGLGFVLAITAFAFVVAHVAVHFGIGYAVLVPMGLLIALCAYLGRDFYK